ncbi:hypothetical protein Tco_0590519 [Tanacetum coccineum]
MRIKRMAFAFASVPPIYIYQLWHTLKLDDSKDKFKFFIDAKEFKFLVDDFRRMFQLPQATKNNHAEFVETPTFTEMLPFFKNELGHSTLIRLPGQFVTKDNADVILFHLQCACGLCCNNLGKNKDRIGMQIPEWMLREEMKLTRHYQVYASVFRVDVPTTQSQPIESTQGMHRTPRAPRFPCTVKVDPHELEGYLKMEVKEKDSGSFTLPCFINDFCFDNALVDLGASVSVMPLSTYLNLGLGELTHTRLIVELADRTVKYPKGIAKNILVGIGKFTFLVDFIILDMPEDIKVPLILKRLFLSTARAKIDVYKRKITLRVGEEKIVFTSIKSTSSLIKMVYMLSLRERIDLDLEARLIGETFMINISLDPFLEDYIKLNDLNEPFELRRNQGDGLMPTIEEGEVIEEFRIRNEDLDIGIDD